MHPCHDRLQRGPTRGIRKECRSAMRAIAGHRLRLDLSEEARSVTAGTLRPARHGAQEV